jgi:probable HAF family extracellular repeat protein
MSDLGTLGSRYPSSGALAINDRGQVVGTSYVARVTQIGQVGHAFLWTSGKMTDLGTLGATYTSSDAVAISGLGQIAGTTRADDGPVRPVIWRNKKIVALDRGGPFGEVVSISDRGQVIGSRVPVHGSVVHAFVWQSRVLTDLGTLGGAESDAAAINERNEIVGVSQTRTGARHAVLWTRRP